MSSNKFKHVFSLCAVSEYYTNGICDDFIVEPNQATVILMKRLNLLWRHSGSYLEMFAELDSQGQPCAKLPVATTLGFVLRLANPDFLPFCDLSPMAGLAAPVFSDNDSGGGEGDLLRLQPVSRRQWGSARLAVETPAANEVFVLPEAPLAEAEARHVIVSDGANATVKAVDTRNRRVTVDTSGARPGAGFTLSYPVRPKRPRASFAEIEITVDDHLLQSRVSAGRPRLYQIPWAVASVRWCYYLLTDPSGDVGRLHVVDVTPGSANRIVFGSTGRVDLSQTPDGTDAVALALAHRFGGRKIVRFMSDAAVACRQAPATILELRVGQNCLLPALPLPSVPHRVRLGDVWVRHCYQVITMLVN